MRKEDKQDILYYQAQACFSIVDEIDNNIRDLPKNMRKKMRQFKKDLNKRGLQLYKQAQHMESK